tara:strand:- start:1664 stop:2074 length:411 start_codon:yes stop_codon:yes gene_type:complete
MASELKVDKFTGVTTAGSILVTGEGNSTTTNLQQGLCKVWINVNQNDHAIRDSFNVSGVTDNGTGRTETGFSNNMANDDYAVSGISRDGTSYNDDTGLSADEGGAFSTSAFEAYCHHHETANDATGAFVMLQGDLA